MLSITIIFALLVALWGFSGAITTLARQRFEQVKARPRPVAAPRSASRSRGMPSASHY